MGGRQAGDGRAGALSVELKKLNLLSVKKERKKCISTCLFLN
jgi:hypothetical protein